MSSFRATAWLVLSCVVPGTAQERPPNLLLITADDLNCDSVGAFGSKVDGTTPSIDALAKQGMRFRRAHVTIAVCQPCRSVWMTGLYPHRSGGEGFHKLRRVVPILPSLLRKAGYRVGLLGKVNHSTPLREFEWDFVRDKNQLGLGRNPKKYATHAKNFFEQAREADKPFFLMANSHDPHRPFHGNDRKIRYGPQRASQPSKIYEPSEIAIPRFLASRPAIRRELAEYTSSVRRCDDTVGALLGALRDANLDEKTVVVFLSDHGMSLPFAKTNCYVHSTRTPLIVRWPGEVEAGSVDTEHFVGGIDLMPTLLEIAGAAAPKDIDGCSFVPLLRGKIQDARDAVFTQFHVTSGRRPYPMRCVLTARFAYIFNPWANGRLAFRNESQNGRTMRAMRRAAEQDPHIARRVDLFLHREIEELYDVSTDHDCLVNLVGNDANEEDLQQMRGRLLAWMKRTSDPARTAFEGRADPSVLAEFMKRERARAGRKKR